MQEGIEDPANAGSSFRVNGSCDLTKEEPGARLKESSRERRRRPSDL